MHRTPPPPGGRAGSENDTLLPLIMTHDWRKFRSVLAFKNYPPSGNLDGGSKKNKTIRHSQWGMPNKPHGTKCQNSFAN